MCQNIHKEKKKTFYYTMLSVNMEYTASHSYVLTAPAKSNIVKR